MPTSSLCWLYPRFSYADRTLVVTAGFSRPVTGRLSLSIHREGSVVAQAAAQVDYRSEARLSFTLANAALWHPDDPTLYDLTATLEDPLEGTVDEIESYLGLREISWDRSGLRLNGERLYLRGVLDQGYFPDGWYTAPGDEALRRDVELTLALGFNCARKHQKAEDPRYLYWADRLGLLVWAEMPSGRIFSTELVETLTQEWMTLIRRDRAHPSIITWVPFNESWGVWHQGSRPEQRAWVDSLYHLTKTLDPSRPVVGNDGWEYSSGGSLDLASLRRGTPPRDAPRRSSTEPGDCSDQQLGRHPRAGTAGCAPRR